MGGVGKSSGTSITSKKNKFPVNVQADPGITKEELDLATKAYQQTFEWISKAQKPIQDAVSTLLKEGLTLHIVEKLPGTARGKYSHDHSANKGSIYISRSALVGMKSKFPNKQDGNGLWYSVVDTTPDLIMHELGHALAYRYVRPISAPRSKVDAEILVKKAYEQYVQYTGHKIKIKYFTGMISKYAATSPEETIAEAFAMSGASKYVGDKSQASTAVLGELVGKIKTITEYEKSSKRTK